MSGWQFRGMGCGEQRIDMAGCGNAGFFLGYPKKITILITFHMGSFGLRGCGVPSTSLSLL